MNAASHAARLTLLAALLVAGCGRAERLDGGGASSVYPVMLKWSRLYEATASVQVDYQSAGSGNAVQQTVRGTIDFGCTDVPLTDAQLEAAMRRAGEIEHVPLVLTGVVPAYNLPGSPTLTFTGEVLSDIYLGKLTRWDDPKLRELNPGVELPPHSILVVFRSDPSGTTATWSGYLARRQPADWSGSVRPGTMVGWPLDDHGLGQKGNEGVAGMVRRLPYSLGYIEHHYAEQNDLLFGAVRNRAGRPIRASAASVTAAAAFVPLPADLRPDLLDAAGDEAYPVAGCVWAVYYRRQPGRKGRLLNDFLHWATATTDGQAAAAKLGYAPLPETWLAPVRARLDAAREGP